MGSGCSTSKLEAKKKTSVGRNRGLRIGGGVVLKNKRKKTEKQLAQALALKEKVGKENGRGGGLYGSDSAGHDKIREKRKERRGGKTKKGRLKKTGKKKRMGGGKPPGSQPKERPAKGQGRVRYRVRRIWGKTKAPMHIQKGGGHRGNQPVEAAIISGAG